MTPIDIKTLHLGSHVSVDGKRVEVIGLDDLGGISVLTPERDHDLVGAWEDRIEPIPLTSELLEELGFEDCSKKRWHTEDWEKRWGECQYLSFTKLYCGEWRVHYFDGAKDRGQTVVRHLHEAEAFLALHGVELIPD